VQYLPVENDFDEPLLREIAESTDGRYYRANDTDSMNEAMKEIDSLEKTTFEQQTLINWRELSFPLIAAALAALLLGFLLEQTVFLKIP
jgi:Ca-activated chloride channel family protein